LRSGADLRNGIALYSTVVPGLHFLGKQFASGRIDAFADDDKWLVEADHDFLAG
jgi:hypothetical protein